MIKKMIKNADKNMLDKDLACKQLSIIATFADEEGMQSISKIAKKCSYKVWYDVYAKSLVDDFKKLMSLLPERDIVILKASGNPIILYKIYLYMISLEYQHKAACIILSLQK